MLQGQPGSTAVAVSDDARFRASARAWPEDLHDGQDFDTREHATHRPQRGRLAVSGDSGDEDRPPATDCISPIGEELILKGLHQVVPGEFYAAATRPPAVYRGNPFQIEVGIAYGGQAAMQYVTKELLRELIEETDARTIRQFLIHTFNGLGSDAADKILKESGLGTRQSPCELEAEGSRKAARGDEGRQRFRRPDDGSAAVCQPRAAAVSAGQLRDHADDPRHQLAELRPVAVARRAAQGPGHGDGPHGQRVGAVHQRIERSDRQLSGNSKRAAAGAASRRAASWACICAAG